MDHLDAMRTFLVVADRQSFAAAARALRLSAAAVTRAVAMLEQDLGTGLLQRTTRSVRLTERGAIYADRCRALLADLDDLRAEVRGHDAVPRGLLSVTAPVVFGRLHILPVAEALMARHDGLDIRLTFLDRVTHLVEEGFDVAVRVGVLADSAMIAVRLTEVRRVVVASPAYLATHGTPERPKDLRRHRIVSFDGVGTTDDWRFGAGGSESVRVAPRMRVNLAEAAIDAALHGAGLTRVLSYQVAERVAAGTLRIVLADAEPPPVPVSLVYPASRRVSALVQAFVREAKARLAQPKPDPKEEPSRSGPTLGTDSPSFARLRA